MADQRERRRLFYGEAAWLGPRQALVHGAHGVLVEGRYARLILHEAANLHELLEGVELHPQLLGLHGARCQNKIRS
jgi:hypothetical protein